MIGGGRAIDIRDCDYAARFFVCCNTVFSAVRIYFSSSMHVNDISALLHYYDHQKLTYLEACKIIIVC